MRLGRRFRIPLWLWVTAMAVMLGACANIGRPSGGDRDTEGPELLGALPHPGTLNFNYREIEFHFDEFLKPGNYRDAVFISPVLAEDPEITVKNKVLKIKFMSPLKENTTYVVTLGTGIADFNEANKMKKSITYAFSTGAVLDSMRITGRVDDMWTGTGEKEMKVLLFKADDIVENDFVGKRPEYMVETDKEGKFEFAYLAPGRYKIIGVGDADNNTKLSSLNEKIGIAPQAEIELVGGDSLVPNILMTSFFIDNKGPKVKSAKWSNDYTVHLEFSEPVRSSYMGEDLRIEMSDTLGNDVRPVAVQRFATGDAKHLYIHAPHARDKDFQIKIVNLMDTLGQLADTTVRLPKESQVREERNRWFDAPVNQRRGHEFSVAAYFALPGNVDSNMVQLLDSANQPVEVEWIVEGMHLHAKPPQMLDPKMRYSLQLRKQLALPDGKAIDTLTTFRMAFPNPDDFGTINGKVLPDSTRPATGFVVLLRGSSGSGLLVKAKEPGKEAKGKSAAPTAPDRFEGRFYAPGPFKYVYLHPGKYTIDIIEDTDGNGVCTPGSLNPYRLPEKVYHQSAPIEIKAKWDMDNVQVYPIPAPPKAKESKKGGLTNPEKGK